MDLYFDVGNPGSGSPISRDQLYQAYVELRDQYESGMQSFAWSAGGSGSYISRDEAYMQLRRMLRKLAQLDGKDYGAGDGTIRPIQAIPTSPYRLRGLGR